MNPLVQFVRSNLPELSPEALQIVEASFIEKEYKKGDIIVNQGTVCKNLYFLADGICRYYSIKDGSDITTWFSFKNEFVTSFTSFFPQAPSYENIELLSGGTLYQISYHQLIQNKNASIELERVLNHFIVLYTVQLEKRLFLIQTHTATEKYKLILEQEPHLIQHIPNKHLASYLGISRETLSRIRSSIN